MDARIEADATSTLVFSGTLLVDISYGPECSLQPCEISQPVGPRALTDAERDELERLLGQLSAVPCDGEPSPVCDLCAWESLKLDGVEQARGVCVPECRVPYQAVNGVIAFLNLLAAS
jgi:hypothetical protein